jgi:hypothetical protein
MRSVRAFAHFWYDFIIGDDWTVATGIVLALAATAILAHAHVPAWWLLPLAALALLAASLIRAQRGAHT